MNLEAESNSMPFYIDDTAIGTIEMGTGDVGIGYGVSKGAPSIFFSKLDPPHEPGEDIEGLGHKTEDVVVRLVFKDPRSIQALKDTLELLTSNENYMKGETEKCISKKMEP